MQASLAQVVARCASNADSVATASAQIAQGNQRPVPAAPSSRPARWSRPPRRWSSSAPPCGRTPTTRARPTSWRWAPSTVAVQGGEVVGQVVDTMKGINDSSAQDRRHHRRDRRHRLPDQHPGAERRGGSGARRRAGPRLRGGGQPRCAAWRSAAPRRPRRSRRLISASVERVEQGTALVDQAGATMSEIVASIQRVTDIMGEISAASAEQSAGVAQVGEAVTPDGPGHAAERRAGGSKAPPPPKA